MKQLWISLIFAFGILTFGTSEAAAQIVVKVKPNRPTVVINKPNRPSVKHVWVNGHWVYSKKRSRYVWKDGYWVAPRRGQTYVQGRWVVVRGGHKWVPGHWKRV